MRWRPRVSEEAPSGGGEAERMYEILLRAPLWFDESTGYWTGEPDRGAVAKALEAVPAAPGVERKVSDEGVLLRGSEPAVREQARKLREAGLIG